MCVGLADGDWDIVEVGDRIVFKSPTRSGTTKAERKVNGFWMNGFPTVRFQGWGDFVVKPSEILEVKKAGEL